MPGHVKSVVISEGLWLGEMFALMTHSVLFMGGCFFLLSPLSLNIKYTTEFRLVFVSSRNKQAVLLFDL